VTLAGMTAICRGKRGLTIEYRVQLWAGVGWTAIIQLLCIVAFTNGVCASRTTICTGGSAQMKNSKKSKPGGARAARLALAGGREAHPCKCCFSLSGECGFISRRTTFMRMRIIGAK